MLDWLGNIGLEHWLQGGAVGALAIALFMVFTGYLVPRRTLDTLRETSNTRIAELLTQMTEMRDLFFEAKKQQSDDHAAEMARCRTDHADRMAEQKEMLQIWREAHAQSEKAREIEAQTNDKLVDGFETLDRFIRGMKTAAADEKEAPR